MNKKIATTLLTLFCFTAINSDSFAQDLLLQEHNFPGVNLPELAQLIASKSQQDMTIPATGDYVAGDQTTRILDEFHTKIYSRVKDQRVLNIGIGLGFADAIMLLTPMKQLDAIEISKPACRATIRFIKSFQHLWPRTDVSYREDKRFNLTNKDILNADLALPSMKYDTVVCLNVSHLMKPSQFNAMLVKILPSLKDDDSRLFLRVGMPTLPPDFRDAYKKGIAKGLPYPGCLCTKTDAICKKRDIFKPEAIKQIHNFQYVDETYEHFNPDRIMTSTATTGDTITITKYVSTFFISSSEMSGMLDRAGFAVVEMYTDTPDQERLESSLITPEILERYFEDGLVLDVIAKRKTTHA